MDIVDYKLKRHARARSVRLSVRRDGSVVVTAPRRVSIRFVDAFVREKNVWIHAQLDKLTALSVVPTREERTAEFRLRKDEALAMVTRRVEYFAPMYGVTYKKISVRNQRTRWGSCSRRGNLNFNYRLVDLPPELVDYVVVHELCHLKEMNHSLRFWALVAKACPDYLALRWQLKSRSTL